MWIEIKHNGIIFDNIPTMQGYYGSMLYKQVLKTDVAKFIDRVDGCRYDHRSMYFQDEEDAMMFKLQFGSENK